MKNLKLSILLILSVLSLNVISAKRDNNPYAKSTQVLNNLMESNLDAFENGQLSTSEFAENEMSLASIQKQIKNREHLERIHTQLSIRSQLIQEQMLTR